VILQQCLAGCALAVVGMFLAMGMVRLAANLVVVVIMLGTCGFVVMHIAEGIWTDWTSVCVYSLLTGAGGALLSLPVLPFSGFRRKK